LFIVADSNSKHGDTFFSAKTDVERIVA